MKIAIVSLYNRFGDTTGDMVQARQTAYSLRDLGEDVLRCYVDFDSKLYNEEGALIGAWAEILMDYDIVHTIPPIPNAHLKRFPKLRAKLAVSTVFWRSFTYVRQLHKATGHNFVYFAKDYLRCFLAWLGIPSYFSFRNYDLLLPNSEDEAKIVRKYCFVKRKALIRPVPNAISSIPEFVDELSVAGQFGKYDDGYVLVPGFFAPRKNQLTMIKAMRHTQYPIVFMGDGPELEKCKKSADGKMHFIPYCAHGSRDFYSYFKYARVVCLPSNCETPGIAALEGASMGARPVVPYEGGTCQYYGWDAEYLNPLSEESIRSAIERAWGRGRLTQGESEKYRKLTWAVCARKTLEAYRLVLTK